MVVVPSDSQTRAADRPRAKVFGSLLAGWRRALGAPAMACGVLAATALVALPLASIIGLSPQVSTLTERINVIPEVFDGTLVLAGQGIGYRSTSHLVTAATIGYVAFWCVLSGGIIDRLARGRTVGIAAFSAACGGYAGRFARLSLITAPVYGLMFGLAPDPLAADPVTGLPVPGATGFVPRLGFMLALLAVGLLVDVTRVRLVVEDRRSVLGGLAAGFRFVRRRPLRILALALLNGAAYMFVTGAVIWIGESLMTRSWSRLLAMVIALLGAVLTQLGAVGTTIAFFQGELAHAQYTASPVPVWPDSAAVEAIRNLPAVRKA